jgi:hypothetical protein
MPASFVHEQRFLNKGHVDPRERMDERQTPHFR